MSYQSLFVVDQAARILHMLHIACLVLLIWVQYDCINDCITFTMNRVELFTQSPKVDMLVVAVMYFCLSTLTLIQDCLLSKKFSPKGTCQLSTTVVLNRFKFLYINRGLTITIQVGC